MTQFEALLPLETWRGDYLQQGCGGLCGHVDVDLQDPSRTSGYQAPYAPLANGEMVVAADDEGHETASNGDGLWAKTDPQLRVVFGYLSEHQLAQAAKALVRTFTDGIRLTPISAASQTAGTKPSSWRSAIRKISTESSPELRPTTGRRWAVCSSHGPPR